MEDNASEPTELVPNDIFAMFEPPPEVDPNRFGPVPVIVPDSDSVVSDPKQQSGLESPDLDLTDSGVGIHPDEFLGFAPILESASVGSTAAGHVDSLGPVASDSGVERPGDDLPSSDVDLPHWTEPATGQVPRVVSSDTDTWSELAGPRWKGEGPDWADDDIAGVFGTAPVTQDPEDDAPIIIDDEIEALIPPGAGAPQRPQIRPRPRVEAVATGERNIPQAIMMGIIMASVALMAFRLGNLYALGLIALATLFGAVELFDTMRRAGVHPATLLGVVAAVSFPLAVYAKGQQAFPLILALLVVFGALWYLSGADTHRPALNLGLTFLGVCWVGGLAAFGALLLNLPDGRSTIVTAIVVTVASDTAALAGGKAFGRHSFHPVSPNKTWEGTAAGFAAAIVAGLVMGVYGISPFSNNLLHAALLGVVGGVLAPLGDLTESMIKRDLGVKDMGRLIPGHGGVLDRVDALLFVLPGVYYLTLVLGLDQAIVAAVGQ